MSELKPCPFCGGEAKFHIYGRSCNVVCLRCQIGTRLEHIDEYEVAVEAWNTRTERTCHDETKPRDFFTCSECHTPIGKWVPVYCPKCGAKVVEE